MNKYPGLLTELGQLVEKLQLNLQFPPARKESRLLPLMPETTMSYAAFSNYGEVIRQALKIFRQELQESTVLRAWWEHGQIATSGPKLEESLEKLAQLHEYLGDEIAVAGAMDGEKLKVLLVAEIRRPGFKQVLQQWVNQVADKSKPGVRVLDLKELATAADKGATEELLVLVRPDFVVAATDVATLRSFNARIAQGRREFVTTPFGQRVLQEYRGGVTILSATDMQKILSQVPLGTKDAQQSLQRSGFADMKYLVWEHTAVAGQNISQAELSFKAPRHGVASWLGNPAPLGSLDFVSPKAVIAGTVVLKSPAEIFEDAKELAGPANASSFGAVEQGEKALKLSLKDDLLRHLSGEMTMELDSISAAQTLWKAMLKVDDADHIQQTLTTLLAVGHIEVTKTDDGGVTFSSVKVPSGKNATEIVYAFVDGYLVVSTSHDAVAEALQLHASGGALGKSKEFLAALPPNEVAGQSVGQSQGQSQGQAMKASALLYQDPGALTALKLQQLGSELADPLAQIFRAGAPSAVCLYGEESAIREASTNGAFDFGAVLVGAAIAIPNLLRSRIAANEASAVGSVRVVNVAEITYNQTYPKLGFATDISKLGPEPQAGAAESAEHAGLVSETLAGAACGVDGWCTKSGFRFHVTAICKLRLCKEYVVVATPVSANTGTRNFCSTSEGVVRFKTAPPLVTPVSVADCQAWEALK